MSISTVISPLVFQANGSLENEAVAARNIPVTRKMLCKPVSYETEQHIISTKDFTAEQLIVSMRLLCSSTDLPVIYDWLPWEYTRFMKEETHVEQLKEVYTQVAAASTSQSFMVLMNDAPMAQVDVFQALADDISLYYEVRPGDFRLQFLIRPERLLINSNAACIMDMVVEFLFSYREVKRLVIQLDEHEFLNTKADRAGFVFLKKFTTRQKTSHLYTCTRESFLRAQDMPQ